MRDEVNEVVRLMDDENQSSTNQKPLKPKRKRKSALDRYKDEIIQRRMNGKTYRQIANFLVSNYKLKTDHTLVFDFCNRCFTQ